MAQKRMFNNSVVGSDSFLEMPDSSQNLYFHLSMRADDDGFVDNWKSIMRMTGKKEDDLKILISKSFILPFESGILVIKHWKLNNYIQKDRYKETIHTSEKALLTTDENNVYRLDTNCIHSIEKNSIEKNSIEENSCNKQNAEIIKCYEENIGLITPATAEILFGYDDIDYQMIIEAIKIASINNKRNCRYIQGILNSWINKGYKVVADIQKEQEEKENVKGNEEHQETKEERIARLKKEWGVEDDA
ncbi:MAG: DnaD domain-containing protein [Clostridia bacterium]